MTQALNTVVDDNTRLAVLPGWVTATAHETPDAAAFRAGAALAVLDIVLRDTGAGTLIRDRLALNASEACLALEGRREATSDIRDAVCLARAGDALGPAGDMFAAWRKLAQINLAAGGWKDRVAAMLPKPVADAWSDLGEPPSAPIELASQILAKVLRQFPREEAAALMLADVTLARAIGWDRPVPLFAAHVARRDIRAIADGAGAPAQCFYRATVAAGDQAIRLAADLDRRVAKVRAIAPKLRAKGSDEALAVFLSHDAVVPAALPLPDRAARRLCDRLVELGVVRELSGRPTFRIYGV